MNNRCKSLINMSLISLCQGEKEADLMLFLLYDKYTKAVCSPVCAYFNLLLFIKGCFNKIETRLKWKKPDELTFNKYLLGYDFYSFFCLVMFNIVDLNGGSGKNE